MLEICRFPVMDQEVGGGVCAQVNMWHCGDLREKGGVLTDVLKMCFTEEYGRKSCAFGFQSEVKFFYKSCLKNNTNVLMECSGKEGSSSGTSPLRSLDNLWVG